MKASMKNTIMISTIVIFITMLLVGLGIASDSKAFSTQDTAETQVHFTELKDVPNNKGDLIVSQKAATPTKNQKLVIIPTESKAVKENHVVPIIVAPELTVTQGESVNVLENVTATDSIDGNITAKIHATNTVNSNVPGDYTVDLNVTDSDNNSASAKRVIHVVQPTENSVAPALAPATEPVAPVEPAPAPVQAPATQAMTMTFAGETISYQNAGQASGQAVIDANMNTVVATWGGTPFQSGSDGLNTHFIGHTPGAFSGLFSLVIGNQIIVTDENDTPTIYTVQNILHVDDAGTSLDNSQNYWDLIVGTGGGERVTLQTCISDSENLVVFAYK